MEKNNALLLVLSTAVISGFSIYMNKFAVTGIDSSIFTFLKNILVACAMLGLIFATTKLNELKKLKKQDWLKLMVIGLVGGSVPFLLYFKGLQLTTSASASLIHKTMFIFVAVMAILFLKEKLNKAALGATALLLIGNYLLIKPEWTFGVGDLLIFAATLLWAVENTYAKHVLKHLSGNIIAFGRMFFGSVFILGFLAFTDKISLISSITTSQLTWIFVTAGMLLLYVVTWYNGLKHVDASLATTILLLGSPITTMLNFVSGKALTIEQGIGSLIIVIGIITFMNSTQYFSIKSLIRSWTQKTKA